MHRRRLVSWNSLLASRHKSKSDDGLVERSDRPGILPAIAIPHREWNRRRGLSLLEVMVVLAVIGILFSMAAPSFYRSIEQSRTDMAAANLRAIWAAERLFWLEHRRFSDDLNELESLELLDSSLVSTNSTFAYVVLVAEADSFSATATRTETGRWSGTIAIDQTGEITGSLAANGEPDIVPGFR